MNDIKEAYKFMNETWNYIKTTSAPAQTDNEAWEQIIDHSNELCREFTKMMAGWMEYLRKESLNG